MEEAIAGLDGLILCVIRRQTCMLKEGGGAHSSMLMYTEGPRPDSNFVSYQNSPTDKLQGFTIQFPTNTSLELNCDTYQNNEFDLVLPPP